MSATARGVDDVDDETAAFFDRTIAEWRCGGCGTEFTVDSVYATMKVHPLECPVCGADEHLARRGDHPERRGGNK